MATHFTSIPSIDISALVKKRDDPEMGKDPGVCEVVRQLHKACREAGFFYVVCIFFVILFCFLRLSIPCRVSVSSAFNVEGFGNVLLKQRVLSSCIGEFGRHLHQIMQRVDIGSHCTNT